VKLGATGLDVSRLCLGCMSYGSKEWRPWILEEEEARSHIGMALEAGINFFDTADMYSLGRSEEITGKMLREFTRREETVIATKVFFPFRHGPNQGGLSRKHIQEACDASLKRLGVDTIDLYQIHRLDKFTPMEEILAALDWLVQQGKVRYLGASSMCAWEFQKCLGLAERNGWARFVSMQNHYNLVYREEEREMIPQCIAEGVGIIPWSPLARGLLTGSRKKLDDKESTTRAGSDGLANFLYAQESDWNVVQANLDVAAARGVPPAQTALAWVRSRPGVTAPIVGATKIGHLEDAIASLEVALTDDEVRKLEAPYVPHPVLGH
jgi:aryl-alcohol dehydrogenase-like predicted oxidoreductase